ncbi:6,7-dimethyl-8-ribityllumazine synthase [Demequina lignilytica]|uniref:6,7-dimethyl-8-ribityllumazine synthase n=1 Tax=Demequina lignilytica TaxID=3051663 RepID=A0AB35ME27_9MICO|nr:MULTISPECIES: 6,7-dimethyl-8-ribityllumazine synthase [unclassified Demequina]MDN4482018.1 6,7-dimethyl-8-ribityllumazine synthase [Demequina sp. SYSU T0a273]MDN4489363.1 6,7-dimethyl-8-ribityllumazine synthase [Demequina sp. SYSU T00068]
MSGAGAPVVEVDANGLTIEIVASLWHTEVMDGLVAGAIRAAEKAGAAYRVTRVPGAFELTVVAESLARAGVDAIACLGVVVRGGTPHFEYVCDAVTRGLTDVSRSHATPVGFGILTTDDDQQALDRAGLPGSREDKGAEAVEAALATALVLRGL